MHPVERLVNLVGLLLEAKRPLTFEEIQGTLEGAYDQEDPETAKRMFERDKNVLRDNGIPVEMAPTDAWEVEEGYIIRKEKYYLPEIAFTPEEISALYVAAHTPGEDTWAEEGLRKLLYGADGGVLAGLSGGPLAAGPDVPSDRLAAVADAVTALRRLTFAYRTARGEVSERHLDPYGLVWRGGHWYVVGLDLDHGEIRSFRCSRIESDPIDAGEGSTPPEGFHAADHVQTGPWGPGEPETTAKVAFSPEVAWWAANGISGAKVGETGADGWVEITLPASAPEWLASWVLGFGPDAEALEPPELREEVVARLEEILRAV